MAYRSGARCFVVELKELKRDSLERMRVEMKNRDDDARELVPFAKWLVKNAPRGIEFELPDRIDSADRGDAFADLGCLRRQWKRG